MIDLTGSDTEFEDVQIAIAASLIEAVTPRLATFRESLLCVTVEHTICSLHRHAPPLRVMGTDEQIKHILHQHCQCALFKEGCERVNIRRSHLVSDSLLQFGRSSFNAAKVPVVRFLGEPAVDEGEPRREFFHFFNQELSSKSGLFSRHPEGILPIHNVSALDRNDFYTVGKIMVTGLHMVDLHHSASVM